LSAAASDSLSGFVSSFLSLLAMLRAPIYTGLGIILFLFFFSSFNAVSRTLYQSLWEDLEEPGQKCQQVSYGSIGQSHQNILLWGWKWQRYQLWHNIQGKGNESKRHRHLHVHCSTIHNSQEMETTQVSVIWSMDKASVVHIHNGIPSAIKNIKSFHLWQQEWNWRSLCQVKNTRYRKTATSWSPSYMGVHSLGC
jgi:hypothetical protein